MKAKLNCLYCSSGRLLWTGSTAASMENPLPSSDPLAPDEMDYRDFAEMEGALHVLDAESTYVVLKTIGESIDYRTNPSNPVSYRSTPCASPPIRPPPLATGMTAMRSCSIAPAMLASG